MEAHPTARPFKNEDAQLPRPLICCPVLICGGDGAGREAVLCGEFEGLAEVIEQIVDVFHPYRHSNQIGGNSLLLAKVCRDAGVRHVVRQADGGIYSAKADGDSKQPGRLDYGTREFRIASHEAEHGSIA